VPKEEKNMKVFKRKPLEKARNIKTRILSILTEVMHIQAKRQLELSPEDIDIRNWFKKARKCIKSKKLFPGA